MFLKEHVAGGWRHRLPFPCLTLLQGALKSVETEGQTFENLNAYPLIAGWFLVSDHGRTVHDRKQQPASKGQPAKYHDKAGGAPDKFRPIGDHQGSWAALLGLLAIGMGVLWYAFAGVPYPACDKRAVWLC